MTTTSRSDLEKNKHVGQISTIMRLITSKGEDILSRFDKINENNIDNTSLRHTLKNSHAIDGNQRKSIGYSAFEQTFGFCKTFKKGTIKIQFPLNIQNCQST